MKVLKSTILVVAAAFFTGALRAAAFFGADFFGVAALRFAATFFFAVAIFIFSKLLTCHTGAKITTKTKRYKQSSGIVRHFANEYDGDLMAKKERECACTTSASYRYML